MKVAERSTPASPVPTAAPAAPAWRDRLRRRWRNDRAVVASVTVFALTWEIIGRLSDSLFLPPLSAIAARFGQLIANGTLPTQLRVSLLALVAGMAIAIVAGIVVGALMGLFRAIGEALDVYIDAMMAAPMVAFVPVFVMVFGLGYATRLVVVVLFAFFPIVINTYAGFRLADADLVEMSRSFGATHRQIIWHVHLPTALGHIQAGLRMGMARGVDGLITGEVLITAVGLGGLVSRFGNAFTMDRLWAVVFTIVILALLSVRITTWISRVAISRGQ